MTPRAIPPFCGLLPLVALALADAVPSQCATQWLPGPALAGCDHPVDAIVEWDPDGAGPRTPVAVIGGFFLAAGNAAANRIVAFDPATSTWSPLGSGMNGGVTALAVLPNGDLVAGGYFTTAGGVAASHVARWDGFQWSPLGSGTNDVVLSLCVLPSGDLVAGGWFTSAGGTAANRIARWNGLGWSALGAGLGANVLAMTVLPNGDLVASGLQPPARWNGSTWSAIGTGVGGAFHGLTTLPNGDLVAGGLIVANGVPTGVARWNGSSWSPLGTLPAWSVQDLHRTSNGDIVGVGESAVRRFNGAAWSTIGTQIGTETAFAVVELSNGALVVGGDLTEVSGAALSHVAEWNGGAWSQLGPSVESPAGASSAAELANGDVAIAATFAGPSPPSSVFAVLRHRVVSRTAGGWSQLGGDFDFAVNSVAITPSGDLVAGGAFGMVGSIPAARVARWNGVTWAPLGSGVSGAVHTVLALPNGEVVVGGNFTTAGGVAANRVARWDGIAWAPLGAGLPSEPFVLIAAPNGDVLAGMGGNAGVARWDGTTWSTLGALGGTVRTLAAMQNGDVVAGGAALIASTGPLNRIARWDGASWQPLGSGITMSLGANPEVRGITTLPNGDLIVCGFFEFAGGVPARGVARWNGSTWSAVAAPIATVPSIPGPGFPTSVTRMANGDVVATGTFRVDDVVSAGFARLTTTCPATITTSGPPCANNTLAAANLPWTGSTFRAQASGLTTPAIALDVLGVSTAAVPLTALLPQAVVGCMLAVGPDVVTAHVPLGSTLSTQLPIPNTAALAGIVLHEQVLTLGLPGGAITTLTSTNRLTLTVGTF